MTPNIFGEYESIPRMERLSPNSPLKFFGEVYIFLFGKYFLRMVVIIVRPLVFPTLPVIPTINGRERLSGNFLGVMYLLASRRKYQK